MDEMLKALQLDIWTLQIEADFTAAQPDAAQYARFKNLAQQVDHRLEMVAGLLQQQEEKIPAWTTTSTDESGANLRG